MSVNAKINFKLKKFQSKLFKRIEEVVIRNFGANSTETDDILSLAKV